MQEQTKPTSDWENFMSLSVADRTKWQNLNNTTYKLT